MSKEHEVFIEWYVEQLSDDVKAYKPKKIDNHIPDLVISKYGIRICVELQITKVSKQEIYDRTFCYLHNNYGVEWVSFNSNRNEFNALKKLVKYCSYLGYVVPEIKESFLESTIGELKVKHYVIYPKWFKIKEKLLDLDKRIY